MEPTSNAEMLRQMATPGTEWDPFTKFNVVLVALLRLLPGAEEKQRRVFEEARAIVARNPEHIQTALELAGMTVNALVGDSVLIHPDHDHRFSGHCDCHQHQLRSKTHELGLPARAGCVDRASNK